MKKALLSFLSCIVIYSGYSQTWNTGSNGIYYYNGGNVGIGTSSPTTKLQVTGILSVNGGAGSEIRGGAVGPELIGGYGSPVSGRMIIGDNSGWKFHISNKDVNNNINDMVTFLDNGNVGVGTTYPGYPLDVNGYIHTNSIFISDVQQPGVVGGWFRGAPNGNGNVVLQANAGTAAAFWLTAGGVFKIGGTGSNEPAVGALNITTTGNVGVGTVSPGSSKLAVEGTMSARKVVVTLANPFPDYVFKKDYKLPTLRNVEKYIKVHNHLPEMVTADSVEKNGLDLGNNQTALVKKVEELTLYLIEMNKKIDRQEVELKKQRAVIQKQQQEIQKLRK